MTTQAQISAWLTGALSHGAAFVIIVHDTFDHGDYPCEIGPDEDFWMVYHGHDEVNMQRVMEVYNLSMDIERQLGEERAFHIPERKELTS